MKKLYNCNSGLEFSKQQLISYMACPDCVNEQHDDQAKLIVRANKSAYCLRCKRNFMSVEVKLSEIIQTTIDLGINFNIEDEDLVNQYLTSEKAGENVMETLKRIGVHPKFAFKPDFNAKLDASYDSTPLSDEELEEIREHQIATAGTQFVPEHDLNTLVLLKNDPSCKAERKLSPYTTAFRGISPEILSENGVEYCGNVKNMYNKLFALVDPNVQIGYTYRFYKENKQRKLVKHCITMSKLANQLGTIIAPYYFNRKTPSKDLTLVITEGEIDALSLMEVLKSEEVDDQYHVVSLIGGLGVYKKNLERWKSLYPQYKKVLTFFDNDFNKEVNVGVEAMDYAKEKYGIGSCLLNNFVDVNEAFEAGHSDEILKALLNYNKGTEVMKEESNDLEFPPIETSKSTETNEYIIKTDAELEEEILLGELDERIALPNNLMADFNSESEGGLLRGTYSVLTGFTGQGKSSFAMSLVAEAIKEESETVISYLQMEAKEAKTRGMIGSIVRGSAIPNKTMTDEQSIKASQLEASKLVYKHRLPNGQQKYLICDDYITGNELTAERNLKQLEIFIRSVVKSCGTDLLILDNSSTILMKNSSELQIQLAHLLRSISKELNIHIMLLAHLKKSNFQFKKDGEVAPITLESIMGASETTSFASAIMAYIIKPEGTLITMLKSRDTNQLNKNYILEYHPETKSVTRGLVFEDGSKEAVTL